MARWLSAAGVRSVLHIGHASGRYLFYLSRLGMRVGGVDLPPDQSDWARIPEGLLDEETRSRLVSADFLELTPEQLRAVWGEAGLPVDVAFSEATFETLLPWRPRDRGVSVSKYAALEPAALARLVTEALPARVEALSPCIGSYLFIEPEPGAGGAGALFERCAERLPGARYGVWGFRPPLDSLFRLSPSHPTRQAVYALVRDDRLTDALRAYADPL